MCAESAPLPYHVFNAVLQYFRPLCAKPCSYPKEGAYCDGLFLDGARWNRQEGCLEEPPPMELFYQMPVIHFKVKEPRIRLSSRPVFNDNVVTRIFGTHHYQQHSASLWNPEEVGLSPRSIIQTRGGRPGAPILVRGDDMEVHITTTGYCS